MTRLTVFILTLIFLLFSNQSNAQEAFTSDTIAKRLKVETAVRQTFFGDSKNPSMTYTEYYDSNGKVFKRISFNNNFNSVVIKEFFSYNDKGLLISEKGIHINTRDSSISNQIYSYNSTGQLDKNGYGEIRYKFNDKGKVIEKIEKTGESNDLITKYLYNSHGQLVSEEEYSNNLIRSKISWEYNQIGQIIKEISSYYELRNNENIITAQYEFTYIYNDFGLETTKYQKQTIIDSFDKKPDNRTYTYQYTFFKNDR